MRFIKPLDAATWFRAINSFSERARESAFDLEDQLRHAYHLMQMAPLPIRQIVKPACDEVKFEQFLACEAFETAVLALVPAPLKYSAARGCDMLVLATVALPGDDTGNFAAAEEFASALLQAWIRSVMALEPENVARPLRESMGGAANPEWPWPQMEGLRKAGSH